MSSAELVQVEPANGSATPKQLRRVVICAGTGCMANGAMKVFEPVSYTHLDVYKRQPQRAGREYREESGRSLLRKLQTHPAECRQSNRSSRSDDRSVPRSVA